MNSHVNKLLLVFVLVFVESSSLTYSTDTCSKRPDSGVCYMLYMAWYYDSNVHQCREFVYGGCGGNNNRFKTEKDCYDKCGDQLIELHPPTGLKVAVATEKIVYIYWYRPRNFQLHSPEITAYNSTNTTSESSQYTVVNNTQTSAVKGTGVTHVVLHNVNVTPQTHVDNKTTISSTNGSAPSTPDGKNSVQFNSSDSKPDSSSQGLASDDKNKTMDNATDTGNGDNTGVQQTTKSVDEKTKVANDTNTGNGDNPGVQQTTKSVDEKTTAKPVVIKPLGEHNIAGINMNISDFIGKKRVPFYFAKFTKMQHYVIAYKKTSEKSWHNITVGGNLTDYKVTGLSPATDYMIQISAVYLTNSSIPSRIVKFKTKEDPSKATNCFCDPHGTIGGFKTCKLSLQHLPWCHCKPGITGLFCEICARGYYRTGPSLPCHKCPCSETSSTGACHFIGGYLHCTRCLEEYTGNLCQRCGNGYYRDTVTKPSLCKKCDGCHNIKPGLICDPHSGSCLNCHFNTTGHRCDRCLPGFVGDPLKNISCTSSEEHTGFRPPATGVIAAVVVGTIVLLSGIVGIIIYRRIQFSPTNRPFWTVELQEDHEGVNFSSVPDDEFENNHEDMKFYEKQQRNQTKTQPYSRLDEDI